MQDPDQPSARILPFPDRSVIVIEADPDGGFAVAPYLCPRAAGRGRTFESTGDACDYAQALAIEVGTGWALLCDV